MTTPHENPDEYTIHGIPRSFFTRKLQAAMDFYGLPCRGTQPRVQGRRPSLWRVVVTQELS